VGYLALLTFINDSISGFMLFAIRKVASKCSSVRRVLVPDFMFFIRLSSCSHMYVLPDVKDMNTSDKTELLGHIWRNTTENQRGTKSYVMVLKGKMFSQI
jgi:hypothetical protein